MMKLSSCWIFASGLSIVFASQISSTLAASSNAATCCSNVALLLPDRVFSEGTNYSASQGSYWSLQEREVSPSCFVLPANATEVSIAITALLTPASKLVVGRSDKRGSGRDGKNRSADGCLFAIRSGGHTPFKGAANIESGVTIDLSNLKQLDIASDQSFISIGPGNRWNDVYSKLETVGLGTSGGRVSTVGVGGLVTGGGISFFSRERGLVCDNVQRFQVVLANGTIAEASQQQNPDLYRALKGGSGNFGVVTRVDMTTFPFGQMWGGQVFHTESDAVRKYLFSYFETFSSSATDVNAAWIHTHTFVNVGFGIQLWATVSTLEYTLPVSKPAVFQPILTANVTTMDQTSIANLTTLTSGIASLNPAGKRQLFASLTFANSAAYMEEFFQLGNQTARTIQSTSGLTFSMSFQSLPYSSYSKSNATGGNSLGLEGQTDDLVVVLLTATWNQASSDTAVYAAAKDLFTKAKSRAQDLGVFNKFLYLNYADSWQEPIAGYGPDSVENLRTVSQKYDPNGVFQNLAPGGFKIPAS